MAIGIKPPPLTLAQHPEGAPPASANISLRGNSAGGGEDSSGGGGGLLPPPPDPFPPPPLFPPPRRGPSRTRVRWAERGRGEAESWFRWIAPIIGVRSTATAGGS